MKILVVGRIRERVEAALAVLRAEGFDAVGATEDDEATAYIQSASFTDLVIGAGVPRSSRSALRRNAAARGMMVISAKPRQGGIEKYVRGTVIPLLRR
ncbi:hypothetical protein [Nocardia jinanensis]|uniref:Uncharacterized protein n=1 Tax=Nocardia jinanensis TaxID=382504 RepID=A0A917S1A3_9NOCA|nr:hypothetical protein [Nocardia jinanensis]GGL46501.1 hypothetical protein GCM10011588_71680 [Nocardia jinanensis]